MQTSQRRPLNCCCFALAVALINGLALMRASLVLAASVDYCYSDIGCFPLSAEFYHPKHRPFNVRPWHRQHIRTQFELFNHDHPDGFMMVAWDKANLRLSKFNPKLETKIIVPGWLDNINRAIWVRKLKDALLWLWIPVNVIVVRWTNFTPYTIATANTRVVGAELANLMKSIDAELHYDPAYYHIIGHSLGAHIAGYCGDRVHGLGRITALDPARPFFQHMPKSVRLDRSDAKFVDAIHSDFTPENAIFLLMSYGMTTPVGHLDFYPNGPPLFQPGCMRDTLLSVQTGIAKGLEHNSLSVAFLESTRYLTACDHQRSHEWFIESITNRECAFVGVRCNEFEGMINGRCTCDDSPGACALMGIHADQMYLHHVHEELWPVRAGSIDYKYGSGGKSGAPVPSRPQAPPPSLAEELPQLLQPTQGEPIDLDEFGDSLGANYNLLRQSALLGINQQLVQGQDVATLTKDEIYAQLKHQAMQMHKQAEPTVVPMAQDEDEQTAAGTERSTLVQEAIAQDEGKTLFYQDALPPDQMAEASEYSFGEHLGALDDLAFSSYLRSQLLLSELAATLSNGSTNAAQDSSQCNDQDDSNRTSRERTKETTTTADKPDRRQGPATEASEWSHLADGHPGQYSGHPKLISSSLRDIENWYEDNGRWHLKTSGQPKYCANQYQLLIFLGPIKSSRRNQEGRLKADLLVSIVGSRGQLMNQRFVPRGSYLSPFTMQPFFILLEGSYSLGQIESVAISWQARNDPDPVQATVTFQSSLMEELGKNMVAYKAKQFPWMPEETDYDHTSGFRGTKPELAHSPLPKPATPMQLLAGPIKMATSGLSHETYQSRYKGPSSAIKSTISGHYSRNYLRRSSDGDQIEESPRQSRGSTKSRLSRQTTANAGGRSMDSECAMPASLDGNRHGCHRASLSRRSESALDETQSPSGAKSSNSTSLAGSENDNDNQSPSAKEPIGEYQAEVPGENPDSELQEELLKLQQANSEQRQELLTGNLMLLSETNPDDQSSHETNSQMPNKTYLVQHSERSSPAESPGSSSPYYEGSDASDMSLTSSDSYFVPLVDPIDDTASYTPGPNVKPDPEILNQQLYDGEIKVQFHNLANLELESRNEDSIVIKQVIVSPLQATYGRQRRTARTFCPPLTHKRLKRDKTLQLSLSMMDKCSEQHYYEQQVRHKQERINAYM